MRSIVDEPGGDGLEDGVDEVETLHGEPLPDDTLQGDLFDSPLYGTVKGDRRMMVFNFFAVDTKRKIEQLRYRDAEVDIQVRGANGIATMADKEFLLYVASLMVDKLNRGQVPNQKFTFTAHDFFRVCGLTGGGANYDRVKGALDRLQGTQIKTNIETGGEGEETWFSWLKQARLHYRTTKAGRRIMKSIEVELCDWLYRAILKDGKMLTYHNKYFELTPMERRLYEIARAHCGSQPGFRMNIEKLRRRLGVETPLRQFKHKLKKIIEADRIPEYGIMMRGDPASPEIRRARERGELKRAPKLQNIIVVFFSHSEFNRTLTAKDYDAWRPDDFQTIE
jgi:plasmid replication initiation protein